MTRQEYERLWTPHYIALVEAKAEELDSDGCSGVPDFFLLGCFEHDIHYRTHKDVWGGPITKCQADTRLKYYIQMRSWFGRFSPMAWWRYWAVREFGRKSWRKNA